MALLSGIRTQLLSWWHGTPLPSDAPVQFQAWHAFDDPTKSWRPVDAAQSTTSQAAGHGHEGFGMVTWNVDATSPSPQMRADGIISHILNLGSAVDVIFLQEVSQAALSFILGDPRIRELWYSSDADAARWGGQSFGTITLLSKNRFDETCGAAAFGPVWRVKYPSRFARDALCCDIMVPSSNPEQHVIRIRLVNVHLDSLPIRPSYRPRQISVISSLIRSAGRGLVAGDFNPVFPEDDCLVQDRGLTDAWHHLYNQDPGFTWGLDGKQAFPPSRLDKIATIGIHVDAIKKNTCPDMSIFWVNASNAERFRQSHASIAMRCEVPGYDDPEVDVLPLVKRWLERKDCGRWLMVVDDADDTPIFFGQPMEPNDSSRRQPRTFFHFRGQWKDAEKFQEQATKLQRAEIRVEHADTLIGMDCLALIFKKQGRWNEAEALEMQVETSIRALGKEHPDTLTSMANLATVYHSLGRYEEAAKIIAVALASQREMLGDQHPNTIRIITNLATIYYSLRRYDEAAEMTAEALASQREMLGNQHPDTIQSMADLAAMQDSTGRAVSEK